MIKKIFAWVLIVLSSILILSSAAVITTVWIYKEPLTHEAIGRLQTIDSQLSQAQDTLTSSQVELERALRIVDAAQTALDKLAAQSTNAGSLLEGIKGSLDDRLLPELKTTRTRIETARTTLERLHTLLSSLNALPFVDISASDQVLIDLIDSANSMDAEIANAEEIATQASTFVSDTSYLFGGDLTETKTSLESILSSIKDYRQKVADWRAQIADLIEALPIWIDRVSIGLTIFVLWFGLSQFGLFLHGRLILRGQNPLEALRS